MRADLDQFPLRLPDGMRDLIKDNAKANGRTMNAEIVAVLERYVEERAAQLKIRLPVSLKQRLSDVAYYSRRTMNAQVVLLLEEGLADKPAATTALTNGEAGK